jgi:cytochrome c2
MLRNFAIPLAMAAAALAGCGPSPAKSADAARIEHGRVLMERYHCGTCHSIPGVAASRGQLAASLDGYGLRSYLAGRVRNEPATLARWIADPASVVPGTLMPDMGVPPADAQAMALYLGQLR